ncbi:MAG: RsmE family RNA methyltransferase [Ginsengibacter sp.]
MALPLFFEENLSADKQFTVSEKSSKHIVQVLRMQSGDQVTLVNGKGMVLTAEILLADKKNTSVQIVKEEFFPHPTPSITIALSLIKNTSRFEWFIEKATEIGVSAIIPLLCKRTEKTHFRKERITSVMISAMLQSKQAWLPQLTDPQKITDVIKREEYDQKYIAHCEEEKKRELKNISVDHSLSKIILIGPEGDFTMEEIQSSIQQNYIPVSLGATRLRTETAGVVAAVLLK